MRQVIAILLCLWAVSDAHAADTIWEALRTPGGVVVMRHSYAPGTFDPPTAKLDDCSTQRNLDESGRTQARHVGEAFRRHGIAVGTILSSPRCRCLGTARLAFGPPQPWDVLQGALNGVASPLTERGVEAPAEEVARAPSSADGLQDPGVDELR